MALKRKRSSPTFSSPASDASTSSTQLSPLPFFYQHSKPIEALYEKPTWAFPTYDDDHTSHHLNSRMRKRHRDNRPDEQQVYASTISKLYDAQRQHPNASPVLSQPNIQLQPPAPAQRSTLHSFWKISQTPFTVPMAIDSGSAMTSHVLDLRCEDCDAPLQGNNVMEIDEDVLCQESSCQTCQRQVCDNCAVLADVRLCLGCARAS